MCTVVKSNINDLKLYIYIYIYIFKSYIECATIHK